MVHILTDPSVNHLLGHIYARVCYLYVLPYFIFITILGNVFMDGKVAAYRIFSSLYNLKACVLKAPLYSFLKGQLLMTIPN